MKIFPLKRIKLSNEYIMTYVFIVLLLYQLPLWFKEPVHIVGFICALISALILDMVIALRRTHCVKCSVSAAVTTGIVYAIYPAVPIWAGILAIAVAIVGKHLLGGTGKNSLNPAVMALVLLTILFKYEAYVLYNHSLMIVIIVLSLPLVIMRPYAASGWITGVVLSLLMKNNLNLVGLIESGVFFWGCMVITDPVTINNRLLMGLVLFVFAFISVDISLLHLSLLILVANLLSNVMEGILVKKTKKFKIKRVNEKLQSPYKNILSFKGKVLDEALLEKDFSVQEILENIESNHVVGLGGAAFPTYKKIMTCMHAEASDKYLIINGVECDPGLVHDEWILSTFVNEITKSIELLSVCIPDLKVIIASKSVDHLNYPQPIQIKKVPNAYPMGAESRLIKYLLNKEWSSDTIAAKEGVLVLNVQTLISIYDAVVLNKEANTKYITLANLITAEAQVIKVTLGELVSEFLDESTSQGIAFTGGGLMQARRVDIDERVSNQTNYIALADMPRYKEGACSKCGVCVKKCPSGLEVNKIVDLLNESKTEELKDFQTERCISCGLCSYYCLAGINLSMKVNTAKGLCVQ